ncbi:MAG: hypothetical protein A4S08_04595 [Proteobacteria bacterium SG_bin4]|nr:MAG: hypothetical protein A4S08_04595 [Proteobacteria bacterium SG_bin4]
MKKDTKNQTIKSPSAIEEFLSTEEGQKFKKQIDKLYEDNLHHIKARDILKGAIQTAINNPAMTPEVKDTADFFILLLDETGNSFKYDADSVIKPVVKIAKAEGRDKGGKKRAENDKRTYYLKEIENEAIANSSKFKIYGYKAEFVREMMDVYGINGINRIKDGLSDDKAIINRLKQLQKKGLIEKLNKK